MKISNILIVAALLLILFSLLAYDKMLRSEYLSGRYKDPYGNFVTLKYINFDAIDVNASTVANVKLVQGPFKVIIDNNALDYVKIKQVGNRLQIDVNFEYHFMYNSNPYTLVISCPKLTVITTNANYTSNNKQVTDSIVREDWNMKQVLIKGFTQDSLSISQDYGSSVVLSNNHIRSVNALIGKSVGSGSKMIILKSNQFQNASLDIRNQSKLSLENASINHLNYHISDSAKLELTGAALNTFKK